MSQPILHHYWPSPFAHKIRLALAWAEIPWQSVEIPRIPPKILLMPLTAGYRRTPVLQVGADVFCDTQNIARYIGESYASDALFPEGCIDRALIFASWLDRIVFPLCVQTVLTHAIDTSPPEFIKDRGGLYFGSSWSVEKLKADLPGVLYQLTSEFHTLDCAIGHSGGLMSQSFSYADISIGYLAWFLRGRWTAGSEFLAKFPNIERIERIIHEKSSDQYCNLSAQSALTIAKKSSSKVKSNLTARVPSLLSLGQSVAIRPHADTSDAPVTGTLHALTETRVSISHQAPEVDEVVVHLPVASYQIQAID